METKIKKRYHLIDELRGFAVFCMVFYHAFYLMAYSFNIKIGTAFFNFFTPVQPIFAALFIFLSGISCFLTRSNLARGLKLLGVSLGVTFVTGYLLPLFSMDGFAIYFGVLHLLSCGMLFVALFKPLILKIPTLYGLTITFALFLLTYNVQNGFLGTELFGFDLPKVLYKTNNLFFLGFYNNTFTSADYFPLLPWIFMFFAGAFVGRLEPKGKLPEFFEKSYVPAFKFLGKHALIIYLVHQPLIFGLITFLRMVF